MHVIDYVTIASLGDALDFGDLTVGRGQLQRLIHLLVVVGQVENHHHESDVIDYVTIASTLGDATDFGNLQTSRRRLKNGCSDSHGGLG